MNLDDLLKSIRDEDDDSKGGKDLDDLQKSNKSEVQTQRKAFENKLGKDVVSKLSDSQIKKLSEYYNSLPPKEKQRTDKEIAKKRGEFFDIARGMAGIKFVELNENEKQKFTPDAVEVEQGPILPPKEEGGDIFSERKKFNTAKFFDNDEYDDYYKELVNKGSIDDQNLSEDERQRGIAAFRSNKLDFKKFVTDIQSLKPEVERLNEQPTFKEQFFTAPKIEASKLISQDESESENEEIIEKLDELIDVIKKDNDLENKEQDYDRKKDASEKRQKREKRIEVGKLFSNTGKGIKKAIGGFQNIIDTVIKFLAFTVLGQIVKFVNDFLKNPKNKKFLEDAQNFIRGIPDKLREVRDKLIPVIDWFKEQVPKIAKFAEDFRKLLARFPFLGQYFATKKEKEEGLESAPGTILRPEQGVPLPRTGPFGAPQFIPMFAAGGMMMGMGTDTIPAMLTPGEFVMSRGAVNMFGADTMMAMNKAGGGTNRPKFGLVPGFSGGGLVDMTETQKKALGILAKYESKGSGDYNAVNQYGDKKGRGNKYTFPDGSTTFAGDYRNAPFNVSKKPLTSLTVGEVLSLQYDDRSLSMRQWADQGKLHAVGKYQFVGNTLPGLVQRAKVPHSAKFDEKAQDILALQLMKERGISPWVGPSDEALPHERAIIESARKDPTPTYVEPVEKVGKNVAPPVMPPPGLPGGTGKSDSSSESPVDNRFGGFNLDFIFKPIRQFLGVDTPNVPTSTKIIVLPAIKQQAKQPTTTQTSNEIPDFMVSSNNDMRILVKESLGVGDLL